MDLDHTVVIVVGGGREHRGINSDGGKQNKINFKKEDKTYIFKTKYQYKI